MHISLIAALGQAGELGLDGQLLWRIRADLQNFKKVTLGHHILMGRKTQASLGRPLPGRVNMVLTRQKDLDLPGFSVFSELAAALAFVRSAGEDELFIIGGGELYAQTLALADRLYLSRIADQKNADVYFPTFDEQAWSLVQEQGYLPEGTNPAWTYQQWQRR